MCRKLTLQEVYTAYKRWVINNPNVVTDVETVATLSSYFVAGKINKSPIISELIYFLSKLLTLFNDNLIRDAYGAKELNYGLREQMKLWLTIIHYCEVFIELIVKNRYGNRSKWTIVTFLQFAKCSSALVLMLRFKELPICHPPIGILQRKKFTEGKETDDNSKSFFKLQRSGRVIRRVDGALPVAFRYWEPIKVNDERSVSISDVKDVLYAESLHILKPLIHLAAIRTFGTNAWKQWLVALCMDITSIHLYNRHIKDLTYEQRLEITKRKLGLLMYLLRSPLYNVYSKNIIEHALNTASNKVPIMSFICGPIIQYLSHWQDIYFYMWAS